MKLANTSRLVLEILADYPETRDDDYLLWLKVIEKVSAEQEIPNVANIMTFGDFLAMAKHSKLPQYETVSRARRKVQEKNPWLRASEEVQAARSELEQEYREFARNG